MKKNRLTEDQIAVLKQAEAEAKSKELCRRHGTSEATFYDWKVKYAGMTASEARRLKELEAEERQAQAADGRCRVRQGGAEGPSRPKMVSPQAKREPISTLRRDTRLRAGADLEIFVSVSQPQACVRKAARAHCRDR